MEKSSTEVTKYLNPIADLIGQGPQASEWTNSKEAQACFLALGLKYIQWCLAYWYKSLFNKDKLKNCGHSFFKRERERGDKGP